MKVLKPVYKVLYYLLWIFFAWAVFLVYPLRVFGRENLIRGRGFVIAPNHLRAIDPMYVLLARGFKKKMLVMGKDELFHINPVLNFLWNVFGAFAVKRGAGNRELLDEVAKEVQKSRGLLLFPEGTRSKDGNLGKLKSGAFVVAQAAGVDIIPCRIWYSAGSPKPFRRISVVFGKPVSLEELGLVGDVGPRQLREAKHKYTAVLEQLYDEYKDRM